MRLNKYLSEAGVCSRREADRAVEAGEVTVNGAPAVQGMQVEEGDAIKFRGKLVTVKSRDPEDFTLIVVNKPVGVICTTDRSEKANIVDYVGYPTRIYPVGRLDKDSEGLILMTDRGDIVNRILRGANEHEKEYAVRVDREVTKEFIDKLCKGVWIEELHRKTKPCRAVKTGRHTFSIVLTQGLNRQVRRMCQALGYRVVSLRRTRIMNIETRDLQIGQYRHIAGAELDEFMRALEHSTQKPYREMTGK